MDARLLARPPGPSQTVQHLVRRRSIVIHRHVEPPRIVPARADAGLPGSLVRVQRAARLGGGAEPRQRLASEVARDVEGQVFRNVQACGLRRLARTHVAHAVSDSNMCQSWH